MEEDELISDKEDEKVRAGVRLLVWTYTFRRLPPLRARNKQLPNDSRRNKSEKQPRDSCRSNARRWTKQRYVFLHSSCPPQVMVR